MFERHSHAQGSVKVDVRQLVIQSLLSPLRFTLYFSSSPFSSTIYPPGAGFLIMTSHHEPHQSSLRLAE